jgi:hypothetical protein
MDEGAPDERGPAAGDGNVHVSIIGRRWSLGNAEPSARDVRERLTHERERRGEVPGVLVPDR